MHIVYIDEVKNDPGQEPYYWLCALAIPDGDILSVEDDINALALDYFGTQELSVETEFHASPIIQGKGPYKGKDLSGRIDLIKSLTDVVAGHPEMGRIQVRLDPSRMSRDDYARISFMFLVERVEELMARRRDMALLIADHDKEFSNANVRSLSGFRAEGTEFEYGRSITRIVDTVHHTDSHHSRLLQLADIYAYGCALCEKSGLKGAREAVATHIKALDLFLWPSKYKHWPPENAP